MENRAFALAAGVFVLLLGAALVAGVLWLNRDERVGGAPYEVTTTRAVSGLKIEAPVRYRGVDVGKVESIRFDPSEPGRVVIGISVDPATPLTRGTYARLGFQGVTGLSFVQLDDDGAERQPLATSAGSPARIPMRPSLFDTGEELVASFGEIADRMNRLLADENQKVLIGTLARFDVAAAKAAKLAESLEPAATALAPLLVDARVAVNDARDALKRAEEMVESMSRLAAKLEERTPVLGQIGDNAADVGTAARSINDASLPRLNALTDELRAEVRVLDRVLSGLADRPQSIVFGPPPRQPGPGETGFEPGR
ncbi:MAG: MCE family protein [Burkholderiales bacterium]|nr:MCE family protein [Burkholderiales bacterium]